MKKTAIIVLSVAMVICIGIMGAFAAEKDRKREQKEACTAVIETQNCKLNCETQSCTTVCETQNCNENCGTNCSDENYVDADSDGVCDNKASNCNNNSENCANYEDTDSDGVCDNYYDNCDNVCDSGQNYVDADSDGVCDNYQTSNHHQNGKHCKNRCR